MPSSCSVTLQMSKLGQSGGMLMEVLCEPSIGTWSRWAANGTLYTLVY